MKNMGYFGDKLDIYLSVILNLKMKCFNLLKSQIILIIFAPK